MPYRYAEWLAMDVNSQQDPPGSGNWIYQPPGTNDWEPWPSEGGGEGGGGSPEWSTDFGLGAEGEVLPWQIRNMIAALAGDPPDVGDLNPDLVDIHDAMPFINGEMCFNPSNGVCYLQITAGPDPGSLYLRVEPAAEWVVGTPFSPANFHPIRVITEQEFTEEIGMGAICRSFVRQQPTQVTDHYDFSGAFPDPPTATPPVSCDIWQYDQVYQQVYQAAIQGGMNEQEAAQVAHATADQLANGAGVPNGATVGEIAGQIDSNLPTLTQIGGAAAIVGSSIAAWLNFVAGQINWSLNAKPVLVSALFNTKNYLANVLECSQALCGFVSARDVPEWPSWYGLGLDIYQFSGLIDSWKAEAEADYAEWMAFDPGAILTGSNGATISLTWRGKMSDCLKKWRGRIVGDAYFTPTQSASLRWLAYYDCARDVLSTHQAAEVSAFDALPTPGNPPSFPG